LIGENCTISPAVTSGRVLCGFLGQEFLDAFPVHQFCFTDKGWREKLVDINTNAGAQHSQSKVSFLNPRLVKAREEALSIHAAKHASGNAAEKTSIDGANSAIEAANAQYHFRFVLSPSQTPAVKSLLTSKGVASKVGASVITDATATATAAAATDPASVVESTPATTGTVAANSADTTNSTTNATTGTGTVAPKVGDGIEISPMALSTCEDVATRVVKCGGAALFIDYGEDHTQEDTLRAFHKHKQVHVLSQVGDDVQHRVEVPVCVRVCLYGKLLYRVQCVCRIYGNLASSVLARCQVCYRGCARTWGVFVAVRCGIVRLLSLNAGN
jgi:NADH dehydrogenase [ubiquinone] 1 alpha subcomplex assembly factor 7